MNGVECVRVWPVTTLQLLLAGGTGVLGLAGLETVLEFSRNGLEVSHAAGTGGLSSLSLLGPVV